MDRLKVARVDNVLLQRDSSCHRGTLLLTQHHIKFQPNDAASQEIPYALLSLVTRQPSLVACGSQSHRRPPSPLPSSSSSSATQRRSDRIYPLQLRFRTFDAAVLGFETEQKATDVFESLRSIAVLPSVDHVYAFSYHLDPPSNVTNGWSVYDFRAEFDRQGVGSRTKAWRISDINKTYEFSPSYPALFIIPARISDNTLQYASKYRSKARIPALTYLHWANNGSITRCAQPLPGLKQARSVQDEKVVEAIFSSHMFAESISGDHGAVYGATTTNIIVDARPTTNAVATYARGGGTENMDHYKGCRKAYMGIENIHVMRDSINRIVEALRAADDPVTFGMDVAEVITESGSDGEPSKLAVEASTMSRTASTSSQEVARKPSRPPLDIAALKKSNWLRHLSTLLEGTLIMTRNVHVASSHIMVHCSDGWDRTSQLAALAEVCLDPYYRTMKGFAVLVEKDWLSFGHRFADRCGHGGSEKYFITAAGHGDSSDEEEVSDEAEGTTVAGGGGAQAAANAFWGFTKQLTSNFGGGGSSHIGVNIKETSPVFTQFLDCVWQIMRQNPQRFEFNDKWLSSLHQELYECRFGTFLANCERERKVSLDSSGKTLMQKTESVWNYMLAGSNRSRFLNTKYDASLDDPKRADTDMGVLFVKPTDVRWWSGLFGERIEEANQALDFEEAERQRRRAEKLRWDEERVKERERKELEERRRLEEERSYLNGATAEQQHSSTDSSVSNHRGAVDLMTASQLQTGNGQIDATRLGYKPRTKVSTSGATGLPLSSSSSHGSPLATSPPSAADAATRFKSWAIGGWDRMQEALSSSGGEEAAAGPSASSSSSSRARPIAASGLASENPWASSASGSGAAVDRRSNSLQRPQDSFGSASMNGISSPARANQVDPLSGSTSSSNPWRRTEGSPTTTTDGNEWEEPTALGSSFARLGLDGSRDGAVGVAENGRRRGNGAEPIRAKATSTTKDEQRKPDTTTTSFGDPLGVGL